MPAPSLLRHSWMSARPLRPSHWPTTIPNQGLHWQAPLLPRQNHRAPVIPLCFPTARPAYVIPCAARPRRPSPPCRAPAVGLSRLNPGPNSPSIGPPFTFPARHTPPKSVPQVPSTNKPFPRPGAARPIPRPESSACSVPTIGYPECSNNAPRRHRGRPADTIVQSFLTQPLVNQSADDRRGFPRILTWGPTTGSASRSKCAHGNEGAVGGEGRGEGGGDGKMEWRWAVYMLK